MNIAEVQIINLDSEQPDNAKLVARIHLAGAELGLTSCSLEFRLRNSPEGDIYRWAAQQIENAAKELRNLSRNLQED